VAWTSGTIELANGVTYSISGGNTGSMSAGTYIYFDSDVSTTTLNVTTTFGNAVGENAILLCYAEDSADSSQDAFFIPAVGVLGVNEDRLSIGAVSTNIVQANAITSAKINVAQLDAISADVGTLTAGLLQNSSGARFIDLDATGTQEFIKHDNFTLLADGTAVFAGTVTASAFTATTATFDGTLIVKDGESFTVMEVDSLFLSMLDSAGNTRLRLHGGGASGSAGIVDAPTSTAGLQLRASGTGADVQLDPGPSGGVVHFAYAKTGTSKTAQSEWLEIKVDAAGNTRYLRLWN